MADMEDHTGWNARFGDALKAAREGRGWTQTELANRMNAAGWDNYRYVQVRRTEDASRAPRMDEALALAEILGISLPDLLNPQEGGDTKERLVSDVQNLEDAFRSTVASLSTFADAYERLAGDMSVIPRPTGLTAGRALYQLKHRSLEDALRTSLIRSGTSGRYLPTPPFFGTTELYDTLNLYWVSEGELSGDD